MSTCSIIDAGPGLNFLASNKERLLLSVLGRVSVPETVEQEILRKAETDARFGPALNVWKKLTPRWANVLPDDVTPELSAVVDRISGLPMVERKRDAKDLGEIMVIGHAVVAAESGQSVVILIDDRYGVQLANQEIARLQRLRAAGRPFGKVILAGTLTILERGALDGHIPGKADIRALYGRLRALDDGLPPLRDTRLLSNDLWA